MNIPRSGIIILNFGVMQMIEVDYNNPLDCFIRDINIHTLLPQQEPFVMVGRLEHFDMVKVVTSTEIVSDNIFVDGGCLSATGLIENMAQTCAARIGYINKYILKKGIQIGFIGAIKNFSIDSQPKIGDVISTELIVIEEAFGMLLTNVKVLLDGKTIATADMKIALKEG